MDYQHDFRQASNVATQALERMQAEDIAPTPPNFELWYVYYAKSSAEVTRAIDILAANGQKVSEEQCLELYQRFLSEIKREQAVKKAGDEIQNTLQGVSGVVKEIRTATAEYNSTLSDVSTRLTGNESRGELQTILKSVTQDTRRMLEYNQRLERELDRSTMVMEELKRGLESVRREAFTDGLTGLANRKRFDGEIKRILTESLQTGATFSLLMIDIDHFKSFNDNFGHQVGDQVLRLVARTLINGVKGKDLTARYGGEEFAIVLPETNLSGAVAVANSLRKTVAGKDVVNRSTDEHLGRITLSAGVAEFSGAETVEDLIERADAALYTAKHNGRNQVAAAPTPVSVKGAPRQEAG